MGESAPGGLCASHNEVERFGYYHGAGVFGYTNRPYSPERKPPLPADN